MAAARSCQAMLDYRRVGGIPDLWGGGGGSQGTLFTLKGSLKEATTVESPLVRTQFASSGKLPCIVMSAFSFRGTPRLDPS